MTPGSSRSPAADPTWELWPARITGGDAAAGYTAVEVYLTGTGKPPATNRVGTHVVGPANPAFPLDAALTLAAGDLVLVRQGPGTAGLRHEILSRLSGTGRFWGEVTGGTDAAGYSWKRKVQTAPGVWADATTGDPLTGTNDARRAPSNVTPPTIPVGQVVELTPSPVGGYEVAAAGGVQTVVFESVVTGVACVGGDLQVTTATLTISGRDLSASLVT